MWKQIISKLEATNSSSEFFQQLTFCLNESFNSSLVNIWLLDANKIKLFFSNLDFADADWNEVIIDSPVYNCIFKLQFVMEDKSLVQLGLPELPFSHNKYYSLLFPWTVGGKVVAMLGLHRLHQEFTIDEVSELHLILLNLSNLCSTFLYELRSNKVVCGNACSPGLVLGEALVLNNEVDLNSIKMHPLQDYKQDLQMLTNAFSKVSEDMEALQKTLVDKGDSDKSDIFKAYCQMMDRHGLLRDISQCMQKNNLCAQSALKVVINDLIAKFQSMSDPYLQSRAIDIKDIGKRVLSYINSSLKLTQNYPKNTVLIGEELTLFDLAEVPDSNLAGVISVKGSRYSHVSIVARALGIPAVLGISGFNFKDSDRKQVFIDGYSGKIISNPTDNQLLEIQEQIDSEEEFVANIASLRLEPAKTVDDYVISILANVGVGADLQAALSSAADGVGLFRSEMLFMTYEQFPSIDCQIVVYKKLLQSMAPKPVIMRTIDIGGDKMLPYLPYQEHNPCLGLRGLRFCLDHPEILQSQFYAMIAASEYLNNLHIMVPMVISLQELILAKHYLKLAFESCKDDGYDVIMPVFGVMLETPVAAMQIDNFASIVDFFSVGSNDLVQYMLAVDRNNHRVSHLFDSLNPAILKLLQKIVDDVHANNKHISICGELASDPIGSILLLAMGYDTLSMSAASIDKIKWSISKFSMADCQKLLSQALLCKDSSGVIDLATNIFKAHGAGKLVAGFGNLNNKEVIL